MLCSKIFYETFGKARNKGWINIVQLILLESSVFAAARELSNVFILKQIAVALIYALFMFWHVKISIRKAFILALLYQAILLSTDYLAYAVNNELCLESNAAGKQYNLENVLVHSACKGACIFVCPYNKETIRWEIYGYTC